MKKFFTLFAGMALFGAINANAEVVDLWYTDWDDEEISDDTTAEINETEDGVYVIKDFLDSGVDLEFTFGKPKPDGWCNVTFQGSVEKKYGTYAYLLDSDGQNVTGWLYGYEGSEEPTPIKKLSVVEGGYSLVYPYTPADHSNYKYLAAICFYSSDLSFNYVNFEFGGDGSAVESIATAEEKAVYYNLNGQKVENPSEGIFIRKVGDKTSKVLLSK